MATPRSIEVTEASLERFEGGSYSAIPVPSEQRATLVDVLDYDKGGGKAGWEWKLLIMGAPFSVFTSFSEPARWKLVQTVEAFDPNVAIVGLQNIDPNVYIGMETMAFVDWQYAVGTEPNYREVKYLFSPEGTEPEAVDALAETPATL